jgi:hypothetical protein
MGTGSISGVRRPGRGVDHPPHVEPRWKKEYSCISIHPLGLRGILPLFKAMVLVGRESEGTWEKLNVVVKCTNAKYVQQFVTKLHDY